MNTEDGTLSFGTAVDMSGLDEGMAQIEQRAQDMGNKVVAETDKVSKLLSDVPQVNIDFVTNASQSLSTIDAAFQQIDAVVDENKAAIQELEMEYQRLSEVQVTDNTDADALEQQKQAIQENIALRQSIIDEAGRTADALAETEQRLRSEASAVSEVSGTVREQLGQIGAACEQHEQELARLEQETQALTKQMADAYRRGDNSEFNALNKKIAALKKEQAQRKKSLAELRNQSNALEQEAQAQEKAAQKTDENAQKTTTLRQRIKELKEEMADLVANGIDQTSEKYRELTQELGRLQDIQGDINTQGSVFANDQAQFQGVIAGLQGVAGGFTAAQGAAALFVGENENLQKVMLKVQSLMSITMGLQQVSQAINKDSAFMLVTINGLKEYWNKLLAIGAGEQIIATEAEVAETTAELANTGATTANTEAKIVNASAAGGATVANIGLAGAFRMVGAAIASIPLGWIAAGISVLIGVISHFISEADKATEEIKEQHKYLEEGNKTYAEAKIQIDGYRARLENFNGTKKQEGQLVEELNRKYGAEMGYCKSVAEWKERLAEKSEAYCQALMAEANAHALAAEAAKLYIDIMNIEQSIKDDTFDHSWFATDESDIADLRAQQAKNRKRIAEMQAEATRQMQEAQRIRKEANLGGFTDPKVESTKTKGNGKSGTSGSGSGGSSFDPKKAALDAKKAYSEYTNAVKDYLKEANQEIVDKSIEGQRDGLAKEISTITINIEKQKQAWRNKLRELAEDRQKAAHDVYMTNKGATEVGWSESVDGKKSIQDYEKELLQEQGIREAFNNGLALIEENGQKQLSAIRQKYTNELISQYGTTAQKMELLERQYAEKIAHLPAEYLAEAERQQNAAVSALLTEDFKQSINWDAVFGDLSKQSLPALEMELQKIKQYFAANMNFMDDKTIKEYTESIAKMEEEIASRNPFTALHNSLSQMKAAKTEYVNALAEMQAANEEMQLKQQEYLAALQEDSLVKDLIESGELQEGCERQMQAQEALTAATKAYAAAQENSNRADLRAINARNNLSSTYKSFSNNLKNVGNTVNGVGKNAQNLAKIFSSDVADGIGKALDFIEDVLGASQSVINAIGDVGKSVSTNVANTAQASSQAMQGASQAAATSIKTVEKASVILTVISAALQVATAIASLFNNDDKKQKEIEALQDRIDQLQWELDNVEAVRIRDKVGNAYEKVKKIIQETSEEIINLRIVQSRATDYFTRAWIRATAQADIYRKSVEKIADEYARLSYTADKALGSAKYDEARAQLENLAEQQLLLKQQIDKENSKKKTDSGKVADWKNQMNENAQEMAELINSLVEDIIGSTAEDIATTLGDAFFDAVASGEDAMEQWRDKANEIIRDVVKRMLVTKFLEEPIGQIFDKYKTKWFGSDGRFAGIDAVIDSMTSLSKDLDDVGTMFNSVYEQLPSELLEVLSGDAERTGTSKGIATASQDSVDENNARLTTIQGHTYSLVQGMGELNQTTNAILDRVTGIERNTDSTNDKLDSMGKNIRELRNTVDDIQSRGLRINT